MPMPTDTYGLTDELVRRLGGFECSHCSTAPATGALINSAGIVWLCAPCDEHLNDRLTDLLFERQSEQEHVGMAT